MLESCWLHHNKKLEMIEQFVLGPGVAHFKASSRRQSIFLMNKEEKLDYHQKLFIQFFYQEFITC